MKKSIIFAVIWAVLSIDVWATKSRMLALGQDPTVGSFYIPDTRSVFSNPAAMGMHTDYAVFEWGSQGTEDKPGTNPEGGFFRNADNFSYGLYLGGRRNPVSDTLGNFGSGNYRVIDTTNAIDFFFGGDMGMQWGARLHYASAKEKEALDSVEGQYDALGLGVGIIRGDFELYANYTLSDEHSGLVNTTDSNNRRAVNSSLENDGTMDVGFAYSLTKWLLFGHYDKRASVFKGDEGEGTFERSIMTAGAGYTHQVSSTARIFMDVSYVKDDRTVDGTVKEEINGTKFPLTVAFEADALSWLTLRSSVSQSLFGGTERTMGGSSRKLSADPINVAAGATLNFGKLKVDGVIGVDDEGNPDERLSRMSKVALHYWF